MFDGSGFVAKEVAMSFGNRYGTATVKERSSSNRSRSFTVTILRQSTFAGSNFGASR